MKNQFSKINACRVGMIALLALLALSLGSISAKENTSSYASIPTTISPEAQAFLNELPDPNQKPVLPTPDKVSTWEAVQKETDTNAIKKNESEVSSFQPGITSLEMGGVPVLDVKPRDWKDNGKVVIYTHGGGYTLHSAASSMRSSAAVADATGMRVLSIDYTLAPQSQWKNTLNQVISVFKAVLEEGYTMDNMVMYGDSAGGGLAAGSILKMRDDGLGMPKALVLWSPWADISTTTGDTYKTLELSDPILSIVSFLKPSSTAYADPEDHKNPYVSPVYGDFEKGFPPTLIQGGTKEVFLSNFVRLYQALDVAGQDVKLDLYEGMPHIFQYIILDAPESKLAISKTAMFMKKHLNI